MHVVEVGKVEIQYLIIIIFSAIVQNERICLPFCQLFRPSAPSVRQSQRNIYNLVERLGHLQTFRTCVIVIRKSFLPYTMREDFFNVLHYDIDLENQYPGDLIISCNHLDLVRGAFWGRGLDTGQVLSKC